VAAKRSDKARRRARLVADAREALKALGLPRQQQNERSALTLLALLDLKPGCPWSDATAPLRGITPMMDHMKAHLGVTYAPNTRETVRRQTVHQFVQAGLVVQNPDDPTRAVNSALTVYQVSPEALSVLRAFGTSKWTALIRKHLIVAPALRDRYAGARTLNRIEVTTSDGRRIQLTPGGQNVLIAAILTEFCPRFTPGARLAYVGDAGRKLVHLDEALLRGLGVVLGEHGKMPDVVVHLEARNWLVLIEAVTSHGPMDAKRVLELRTLFRGCTAGLVFVTAFPNRATLAKYLPTIAWETDVWVAEAPDHLIHFNGERFLGPYPEEGS
jgi:hypothetical protein